jgi:uncharacterized ion transporter superfamily protein YfcC
MTALALAWEFVRLRGADIGGRAALAAVYVSAGVFLVQRGPALWHGFSTGALNILLPGLVHLVFFSMMFMLFGALVLGKRNADGASRGLRRFLWWAASRSVQFVCMTIVNLFVLAARIGGAIFSKDPLLPHVVEASTHFIEREADLIFKPMR